MHESDAGSEAFLDIRRLTLQDDFIPGALLSCEKTCYGPDWVIDDERDIRILTKSLLLSSNLVHDVINFCVVAEKTSLCCNPCDQRALI